ncbi:saccharopine dehydrogenase-like oxidoreductase [Lucilia sericata]|uniref:saccharopine dehydrogenase-like oxidoreductase n=1 Tax=Lucilia sericata TaxID=13632 RepID=UPI0018A81E53|nr:saccharopine dehydrogenase-like oxidoreductase [Lucilia sericata]
MSKMDERLDAIIFGATGFTGKIVMEDAVNIFKDLKWGIAGRNEGKLKQVLKEVGEKAGKDLSNIPIIVADVSDEASVENMAKKCKIVLNCCGPYRFYGETVVKACIAAGTHHVDISGEPQYIDKMQLDYNDLAQEKGVYVVSSCAYESIPAEIGVVFAEKNFPGTVNSVELFWENELNYQDKTSKAILNSGTWDSVVFALQYIFEMMRLQYKLNRGNMPTLRPKLRLKLFPHKSEGLDSYFIPFPNTDRASVLRSQRLAYDMEKKRPIQFEIYKGFKSCWTAFKLPFYLFFLTIMAQFSCTRNLLLKHPKYFTNGLMSPEGPVAANRKSLEFNMTFKAKGWTKGSDESLPPNKEVIVRLTGNDPCYGFSSGSLLSCAKVILQEHKNMPESGGVIPPGIAFAKTQLIEELTRNISGLKFEVVKL